MSTPVFTVGERVRVRVRHTGMQYHCAGQEAPVLRRVPGTGCASGGWYLVDVRPDPKWYAPQQLESVG